MSSPFSGLYKNQKDYNTKKILESNKIIDVARELGLSVARNVIPCIKKENHVNHNGPATMTFNLIKNTFRCWVCPNVGGNVIDLVMQVKNINRDKALQYLSIRSDIKSYTERNNYFNEKNRKKINPSDRESIFRDFLNRLDCNRGIDLIAFASTKGGTGKTLVVNNLSVIISLIARYIGKHRESSPQTVELIDLDFGKPDQRLLLGIEPEYFIEDIFYQRRRNLTWELLRQNTPAENLKFISSCPVRKSNSLYYRRKNEILYMLHNSDAKLKLADFGGGSDKDTLDFLGSIRSKVFVINSDRASVEAVFNLILSLLYYTMKQRFKGSSAALNLVEKLRDCRRNGFTIEDLRDGFHRLDKKRTQNSQLKQFYDITMRPFKKKLGIPVGIDGNPMLEILNEDLLLLREKVNQVLFHDNGKNGGYTYAQKSSIYRTFTTIEHTVQELNSYSKRLKDMLETSLFGLIINKCDKEEADAVASDLVKSISDIFSMRLTYLGDIPEEKALRNISNYQMPFIIFDPNHPVISNFSAITDKIIGLSNGSTVRIIQDQKDHIGALENQWANYAEHAPVF